MKFHYLYLMLLIATNCQDLSYYQMELLSKYGLKVKLSFEISNMLQANLKNNFIVGSSLGAAQHLCHTKLHLVLFRV